MIQRQIAKYQYAKHHLPHGIT